MRQRAAWVAALVLALVVIGAFAAHLLFESSAGVVARGRGGVDCGLPIVLFDSTWSAPRVDLPRMFDTNVTVLAGRVGDPRCRLYEPGIGANQGTVMRWLAGLFGIGIDAAARRVFNDVRSRFSQSTHLVIVGASTGAVSALHLSEMLKNDGQAVELLLLFDMEPGPYNPIRFRFPDGPAAVSVPDNVRQTIHLLSIDEGRTTFLPLHVNTSPSVKEVWFRGSHSDITGGNGNVGRTHIALSYALDALRRSGVLVESRADAELRPDWSAPYSSTASNQSPRVLVTMSRDRATSDPITVHRSVVRDPGPVRKVRYVVDESDASAPPP